MAGFLKFKFLIALKLNFNGSQFYKKNIKIWLLQKVGKSLNKIVKLAIKKLEVEISSICAQIRELFKNENSLHLSCNFHIIGEKIYSNLEYAPFSCKKVWPWMDGWMDGWMGGWVGGRVDGW